MTAVEWLGFELNKRFTEIPTELFEEISLLFIQAKQMEKKQTVISDEEIENEADRYEKVDGINSFKEAIKWYREQLKKI